MANDQTTAQDARWKHDSVRVIPGGSLDANTAQTPGMDRRATRVTSPSAEHPSTKADANSDKGTD